MRRKLTWMITFKELVWSQGLPPFLKDVHILWRGGFMFFMCMLWLMFGFLMCFLSCLPSVQMPVQVSKQALYYRLNMSPIPAFVWHLVGTNNFCLSAGLRNLRFNKHHLWQPGFQSVQSIVGMASHLLAKDDGNIFHLLQHLSVSYLGSSPPRKKVVFI